MTLGADGSICLFRFCVQVNASDKLWFAYGDALVIKTKITFKFIFMIHIDPLGQPTFTAGSAHYVRTWCPSVRPSPLFKSSKTNEQKTMVATGEAVGLAEWIIDDTCLVENTFVVMVGISTNTASNQEKKKDVSRLVKDEKYPIDPLGQPTVPAGSDCRLWRTLCVKIVITTGRDCGRPRGSILSYLSSLCKLAITYTKALILFARSTMTTIIRMLHPFQTGLQS